MTKQLSLLDEAGRIAIILFLEKLSNDRNPVFMVFHISSIEHERGILHILRNSFHLVKCVGSFALRLYFDISCWHKFHLPFCRHQQYIIQTFRAHIYPLETSLYRSYFLI